MTRLCADPWKDTDGQAAKELEHASPLHLLAYRPVGTRAWSSVNQVVLRHPAPARGTPGTSSARRGSALIKILSYGLFLGLQFPGSVLDHQVDRLRFFLVIAVHDFHLNFGNLPDGVFLEDL